MSNAVKIAQTVKGKLPYPVTQLSHDLALKYGKDQRHWSKIISIVFADKHRYDGNKIANLTKTYIGDVYCIVEDNGEHTTMRGKPGPTAWQYNQDDHAKIVEKLAWQERVFWQEIHPTDVVDMTRLSDPELWLDRYENASCEERAMEIKASYGEESNWKLVEQAAWLYCSSNKRPEDAYGRSGKRVLGARFCSVTGKTDFPTSNYER